MKSKTIDLANRRRALRVRIYGDERKLAIAYPQDVEKLEQDLERERAMLAQIDAQVEEAKDEAREEMRSALDRYFTARDALVKLNGWLHDPGFRSSSFTRVHLGATDSESPIDVKATLLKETQMPHAPEPTVSDNQRLWDERIKNERAGRGLYTDDELGRKAEDPGAFAHGAGFREIRPMTAPGGNR